MNNRFRTALAAAATLALAPPLAASAQIAPDLSYQYDAMGRPTVITNGKTYATERMQWDTLGRLVSHTNRMAQKTTYGYTGSDAPTSVQAPNGAATVFDVDGLGLTRTEISPDRGAISITYDGAGNPFSRVDARGARIDTRFDVLNRPTEIRYTRPDGGRDATHSYTWDSAINGIGRIARIATDSNALEFEYDAGGRVAGRTYTRGERVLRTRAFHNAADGNLDVLTYPSGSVITYHYDAAGQLTRLEWDGQPIAANIAYAPFGPPTAYQLANGITHRRTHDSAGRINSYTLAGAVTDITYDSSGNIAQLSPRTDPGGLQTFQFDGGGRVTRYVDTALTETFSYDSNGNRTSSDKYVSGWETTHYNYAPFTNRVTAIDGATLTHDAAGNRVADVARGYTYNAAGRLTEVRAAGVTARYEYNGLGERVYKYVDTGLTRHYAYDTAGHLIGEYDASGAPVAEYAWLGDLPVAMRATRTLPDNGSETTLYAIETDHLGTPRALTDPAGQLRWHWHSAPFGDTPPNANPAGLGAVTFNLRFPGQYYDAESGLHYNYYRDYDPGTGRYVQSDPIGLMGGVNTYGYVGGNPVSRVDPLGLKDYLDECVGRYTICANRQNPDASTAANWLFWKICKWTVDKGCEKGDTFCCDRERESCLAGAVGDAVATAKCMQESARCIANL
ncbi:MAG: RHS repeat protein [Rhodocyclales bacterium]|nr:RHS repeat protein [Rhodocyclales bacterium]